MTEAITDSQENRESDPVGELENYIISKFGGNADIVRTIIKYSVSYGTLQKGETTVQELLDKVERADKNLLGKVKIDENGKPIIKLNKKNVQALKTAYGISYEELKGMDPSEVIFSLTVSDDIISGMDSLWSQMNTEFNHWWKEVSRIQSEIKRLEHKKAAWRQYDKTWNREPMQMARDMSKPIPEQFTSADQTRLAEELPSDLRRAEDKKDQFKIKMEIIDEAKELVEEYFKNRFYKTGKVGI